MLTALSLLWLSLMLEWVPSSVRGLLSPALMQVVATLPLWSIVAFGAYSLASIGISLCTFRDCPQAFVELDKDINTSRARLQKKGFTFDNNKQQ